MFESPATGGFVNAVAYAQHEREFCEKATRVLQEYGVRVLAIEGITPVEDVLKTKEIEPALVEAIRELSPEQDARLGSLFCYHEDN
jgi:predicted Fe-Mo cluster-binding NifX family protein